MGKDLREEAESMNYKRKKINCTSLELKLSFIERHHTKERERPQIRKIFTVHTSDKELVSRVCKSLQ